jgi:hypothetical protein
MKNFIFDIQRFGHSTYSFDAVTATFNFAGVIPITITGQGAGSIDTSMSGDKTVHDVAADGSVMVSKVLGNNGTIALSIQQTSPAHRLLRLWYNYLLNSSASVWAENSITIRDSLNSTTIMATGVSPQKKPDIPYKAQGQQVVWNFMAAEITELPM